MAGFVLNILSEEIPGSTASIQTNTGGPAVGGQFKRMLQQASSESVDFTKPLIESPVGVNSGKDLPIDLSFSEQVLAGGSVVENDNQKLQWSGISDQKKISVETGSLSDVSAGELKVESGSPELDFSSDVSMGSESSLSFDNLVSLDLHSGSNNSKISPNIPANSVDYMSSTNNKKVTDSELAKNINSLQKGTLNGVSMSGQSSHVKPQEQLIQSSQAVEQAEKAVKKVSLTESVQLTLDERQTKLITEGGLQDKKLQEIKLMEPMKSGTLVEEEDFSEMLKPESSKFQRQLAKSEQLDNLSKTDIGQITTQLKNSKLYGQAFAVSNSTKNTFSVSELDLMPAINKLAVTANTEMTTSAVKDPQNIIANSAIQSGLSLKRNFSPNLAARIQWIYHQAISSAEILMDPPELGPLSVKLTKNNGETNILFQVTNPSTKEAIEDNLAKLKELLSEQGINLGDTQVEQQQKNDKKENLKEQIAADSSLDSDQSLEQRDIHVQQGLLDTYI